MIKIKDFVINNKCLSDVPSDSVGFIKAINKENAMVLFIGLNKILRVDFEDLIVIDPEKNRQRIR